MKQGKRKVGASPQNDVQKMSLLKEIFDKIFSNLTLKDIRERSVKAGLGQIQTSNPG